MVDLSYPAVRRAPEHRTVEERAARGKAARASVPRESHAEWEPGDRRHSPLDLLAEQAVTRVPELVPIRHGRMAASPFAYFRGAALPMAADLATSAHTGLTVQLCGDAHLANFGGFASPERAMVFDVNDFDETLPGPFEWDLKRLAASLEVAARSRGFDQTIAGGIVAGAMSSYQQAIRDFAGKPTLEVWYARLDVESTLQRWSSKLGRKGVVQLRSNVARATAKDQMRARAKLVRADGSGLRFVSDPPLLVPAEELFGESAGAAFRDSVHDIIRGYRRTLPRSRRRLLESYRYVDLARKVVGVGSVGTRAWVALFVGRDVDDTLILQVKEAEESVLERFLPKSTYRNHGERVVEGQQLMQAASDIFLGWHRVVEGQDGRSHDYYVRQLWDWKLSPNIDSMDPARLGAYAEMCGWTLARAHARSGDAIAIASYLGRGPAFANALTAFARSYADQNDLDYEELLKGIRSGRVAAESVAQA